MVGPDGQLPLPWLAEPLQTALAHPAHALLLVGSPGVGALEFQLTLAQAWLCEAHATPAAPCGQCTGCRLMQSRTHPDLMLLMPESLRVERGWTGAEEGDGEGGKRKPSKQIRISEVRSATDWIVKTTSRGRAKVLVLHPAEALNLQAASALLKTLEEPPAGARMLLSCSDADRLLPTVRSRCQRIELPAPPTDMALAWLREQGVAEPAVLLAACGGRPLEALALQRAGVSAAVWSALPQALARGQAAAWAGWPLSRAVDTLQKLCHDLTATAVGGSPRFFPRDSLPSPRSVAGLSAWGRNLARTARQAEHPWNEGLLLESLVSQGHQALATLDP